MAVTYRASLRTARMNLVKDDIDSGAGAGYIEIGSAGFASVLATITLADPCGSVSGDVLTLTMPRSDSSADNTGTASVARIKNSDGTIIIDALTVGTSSANLIVNTTAFVQGQQITVNSFTLTHPTT